MSVVDLFEINDKTKSEYNQFYDIAAFLVSFCKETTIKIEVIKTALTRVNKLYYF